MRTLVFFGGLGAVVGTLAACSFTTAGNFKECTVDTDCGTVAACSSGYCLPLPSGCVREESGGTVKPFEHANRIPLVALLPIGAAGDIDDSEVQSANAIKLALSEGNDRLSDDRGFFGLFVCNTRAADAGVEVLSAWFVKNLSVPAMFVSSSGPTLAVASEASRKAANTLIISPNATNPELTTLFSNDRNVWRVAPPDDFQAKVMTSLVRADLDAGSIVTVLASNGGYGEGFANPLYEQLKAVTRDDGGAYFVVNKVPYSAEDKGIPPRDTAIVTAINTHPNATIFIGNPRDALYLFDKALASSDRAMTRDAGHRWFLTDSVKDEAILTPTTRPELEGAWGTAPAQGSGAAYPFFRDVFRTRYGIDPDSSNYVSHSYDAAWLVMLATQYALGQTPNLKNVTGAKLGEGMAKMALSTGPAVQLRADKWAELSNALSQGTSTNIEGTSGPLDLDLDAGFAMSKYEVWQVSDGGIRVDRRVTP